MCLSFDTSPFFFEQNVWLACYYFVILRHKKNEQ